MPKLVHKTPMTVTIPNRLFFYRNVKGMTQLAVATEIDMSYGSYCTLESGHFIPSLETITKLCSFFSCQPEDLYEMRTLVIIGLEEAETWLKDGAWWENKIDG